MEQREGGFLRFVVEQKAKEYLGKEDYQCLTHKRLFEIHLFQLPDDWRAEHRKGEEPDPLDPHSDEDRQFICCSSLIAYNTPHDKRPDSQHDNLFASYQSYAETTNTIDRYVRWLSAKRWFDRLALVYSVKFVLKKSEPGHGVKVRYFSDTESIGGDEDISMLFAKDFVEVLSDDVKAEDDVQSLKHGKGYEVHISSSLAERKLEGVEDDAGG